MSAPEAAGLSLGGRALSSSKFFVALVPSGRSRLGKSVRAPPATSPHASNAMRANRRSNTSPERALRSELHRRGLRFRKDLRVEVRQGWARPDVVFTRQKLAVFVDGCFWHRCGSHGRMPKSNQAYWAPKLARNVERDRRDDRELEECGWRVLRFFEHVSPPEAAGAIARELASLKQVSAEPD
jgi:DNA mismatch endonuclease (patch repair protein)